MRAVLNQKILDVKVHPGLSTRRLNAVDSAAEYDGDEHNGDEHNGDEHNGGEQDSDKPDGDEHNGDDLSEDTKL